MGFSLGGHNKSRVARSPSRTYSLSWAELNAPMVAFIYAHCDIILPTSTRKEDCSSTRGGLNNILPSFYPFESLCAKNKKSLMGFSLGGHRGIRTPDHRLKRPLLYQLSYVPQYSYLQVQRY